LDPWSGRQEEQKLYNGEWFLEMDGQDKAREVMLYKFQKSQ